MEKEGMILRFYKKEKQRANDSLTSVRSWGFVKRMGRHLLILNEERM